MNRIFSTYHLLYPGLFLFLLLPAASLSAQIGQPSDSSNQVRILNADLMEQVQQGEEQRQSLQGEVVLRQDSIFLYCDTATIRNKTYVKAYGNVIIQQGDSLSVFADTVFFDGEKKLADLTGREVILINQQQQLFTRGMTYDLNTKIANYTSGGLLDNGRSQLSSKQGYYYARDSLAFFRDSVVVVDSLFSLRTDSLRFKTTTEVAYFLGPTRIDQEETDIYCENGFYDIPNQQALFSQNAQYQKGEQRASADSMYYDGTKKEILLSGNVVVREPGKLAIADRIRYLEDQEKYYLYGHAYLLNDGQEVRSDTVVFDARNEIYTTSGRSTLSDSSQILQADFLDYDGATGRGLATGQVYWQDTTEQISILCERAIYDKACDYLLAVGERPLFISGVQDDSLYMSADTLEALGACDSTDSAGRRILAYRDVRIYKTDLQAKADSLTYSESDSLFTLYPITQKPLIWADTSQMKGDTIRIQMANDQIDRIFLIQNAWLTNSPDLQYFNQIKGRNITARFRDNELHTVWVEGNAEALYYVQDENKAYIGPNQVSSGSMKLSFANNQVTDIRLYQSPSGDLKPFTPTAVSLEGFKWDVTCRPAGLEDLLKLDFCQPQVFPGEMPSSEKEVEDEER